MLSPYSSMVWAVWIMRSRIASAIVGSPTISYQLEEGYCEVMMMDFLSCLSSIISSSMGRSLASRGTRQRSSRMSSWQRSIFLSSVSSVPLILATFNAPSSLGGHWHRMSGTPFCMPHVQGRRPDSFSLYRKSR